MWNHHLLTCATNKTKKIGGINKQSNCARPRPAVVLIPLPRAPVKAVKSKSSGKWVDFPASHVSGPRGVTRLGNYIPSTQTFQMKIPIYIWFLLVIFPWPFDLVYSWEKTHTHTHSMASAEISEVNCNLGQLILITLTHSQQHQGVTSFLLLHLGALSLQVLIQPSPPKKTHLEFFGLCGKPGPSDAEKKRTFDLAVFNLCITWLSKAMEGFSCVKCPWACDHWCSKHCSMLGLTPCWQVSCTGKSDHPLTT